MGTHLCESGCCLLGGAEQCLRELEDRQEELGTLHPTGSCLRKGSGCAGSRGQCARTRIMLGASDKAVSHKEGILLPIYGIPDIFGHPVAIGQQTHIIPYNKPLCGIRTCTPFRTPRLPVVPRYCPPFFSVPHGPRPLQSTEAVRVTAVRWERSSRSSGAEKGTKFGFAILQATLLTDGAVFLLASPR